jgi:hypothetical protein
VAKVHQLVLFAGSVHMPLKALLHVSNVLLVNMLVPLLVELA